MISEKKINYYLHFAENSYNPECKKIIMQLVDEVRKLLKDLDGIAHDNTALELKNIQLEREADWLAYKCSIAYINRNWPYYKPKSMTPEEWREQAKKAIKKNDS